MTKRALDCLVHPETHLICSKDHSDAMVLLSLMHNNFLHLVKSCGGGSSHQKNCVEMLDVFNAEDQAGMEEGSENIGSDDMKMLAALLKETMLRSGRRVCRSAANTALSRNPPAPTSVLIPKRLGLMDDDVESRRGSEIFNDVKEAALTWGDFYSPEELKSLLHLSVTDLISNIASMA